jgi:hypothetical protein
MGVVQAHRAMLAAVQHCSTVYKAHYTSVRMAQNYGMCMTAPYMLIIASCACWFCLVVVCACGVVLDANTVYTNST